VKYSFQELVDIPRLQELTDELFTATGIPSAIIAMDGEIVTGSGWQRICTEFHRKHPEIERDCIASDVAIRKGIDEGEAFVMYRCPRGLVDGSAPIVIDGEHVANAFTGQLFTEPPDERTEQFFREQARQFGLDEAAYIAAFREVPVLAEAAFRPAIALLAKLAGVVASAGLARLRALEAAAAARAAETKYRIVADNTLDWEFWLGPAGRYVYVSPSCERITGYAAAAFETDPGLALRLVHHDDRPAYLEHVRHALSDHLPGEIVFRITRPDGTERWIEHICRPIVDADGAFLGTRGSNRDITDRRWAEGAAREASRFSDELIRSVQDGLVVYGRDLRYAVWNPAMERLTGIPASDVLGKHPLERFPLLRGTGAVERLERCLAGEILPPAELPFDLGETGRAGWVSDTIMPLRDATGAVVGIIGLVRETTVEHQALEVLRERHERLREAQRLANLGSWSWDAATDTVAWSEEMFRISGRDPAGPAPTAAETFELFTPESCERLRAAVGRALSEGESHALDLELVRPDGTRRGVTSRGEAVRDAAGRIVGLRGMLLDITEAREAAERLRSSEAALNRAQAVAHVGSWVWHVQDDRLEWSDEMYRIFGIEREGFSGELSEIVARCIHPDDRAAVAASNAGVVAEGRPTPLRYRVVRPDGTVRVVWAEAGDLVRDEAGRPLRLSGIVQDITPEVQAEEALRLSEEQFRRLYDASPVPVVLVAPDTRFERCNAAFCDFLGYVEGEFLGRTFQDFTHPEDLEVGLAAVRAVLAGDLEVGRLEKRYVHRSGRIVWGGVAIRLIRDARGAPVHFLTVIQDLTAAKEAEAALRRSEARFRAIFHDSPVAIFEEDFSAARTRLDELHASGVTDLRAYFAAHPDELRQVAGMVRILEVNDAAVQTMGARSREELVGAVRPPHSAATLESFREELVALDAGSTKFSAEFPAVSADGRPMWLALSLAVQAGSESTLERVVVSFVDITARKQAEAQLVMVMKAVDSAGDAVGISDAQGRHIYQNRALSNLFGYETAEELAAAGGGPAAVRDPAVARELFAAIMSGQSWAGELEMVTKDGRVFPAYERADAIVDREGHLVGLIGIITDITERKRIEAEMAALNAGLERRVAERTAQLEIANREMESFTYSVSHDLRAPLRAIDGYGKAFAEDFGATLAPAARDYLDAIRGSTRRMSLLVDGLLALSRLGRQRLNVETIGTADIVRTALADAGARERQGILNVVVGDLPPCRADGTLLRQVFVNLLQNAFKFTVGPEPARVEVGCREVDGEPVYFVQDNGVGFDMRYADKLFQPFQRLHKETEFAGNGVGLAIVHRIVERHGGRVWAESAPGQGATFYFTIGEAAAAE
jgi:PAS domain S-box-containing protein